MENLQELVDLELVVAIKPHPRHVDVAQFGYDHVLHCIHVLFVVVGNTPWPGPSAHELLRRLLCLDTRATRT